MLGKRFSFLSRGEDAILASLLKNLDLSIETTKHLTPMIDALKDHDHDNAMKEYAVISELEAKADSLHLSTVNEVSSGSFFGGIREDILALLGDIENIADSAKACARIFQQRRMADLTLDYFFVEDISYFIGLCLEAEELLRRAVSALGRNKSEVIHLAEEIEKKEEEADAQRARIFENLLRNSVGGDLLDIVMLKDFLALAADLTDHAEHASDVLLMLVSKGFS